MNDDRYVEISELEQEYMSSLRDELDTRHIDERIEYENISDN